MADYKKIGLLAIRGSSILLCRKKHTTSLLILPGGCLEPGETAVECLNRELKEELGDVRAEDLEYLGCYRDRAAGSTEDAPKTVEIQLYCGKLMGEPVASAEIKELVWFGPGGDWSKLAPSLANTIFPDLLARRMLPWDNDRMPVQTS